MAPANTTTELDGILGRLSKKTTLRRDRAGATEIVWREIGRGSPLVLIHGGHGSWMHWIRNIEVLSEQHTLWLPDLPGFGGSGDIAGDPYAADRLDRLVEAVARSLEGWFGTADDFALAGFSFGGLVAARLAAAVPNVGKLALLGSAGHGGKRRQTMEMINWRLDDREQMLHGLRHNLAALMLHDAAKIDELAMAVHEQTCRAARFRSKAISRGALLEPALDSYHGPTLLIWGEHDVTAEPVEAARKIAGNAAHREWSLVPGAGHWVQFERPKEVNQLLLRWFTESQPEGQARVS